MVAQRVHGSWLEEKTAEGATNGLLFLNKATFT